MYFEFEKKETEKLEVSKYIYILSQNSYSNTNEYIVYS